MLPRPLTVIPDGRRPIRDPGVAAAKILPLAPGSRLSALRYGRDDG